MINNFISKHEEITSVKAKIILSLSIFAYSLGASIYIRVDYSN